MNIHRHKAADKYLFKVSIEGSRLTSFEIALVSLLALSRYL